MRVERGGTYFLLLCLLDRLNESSLCIPWDKSLLITPPLTPHPHIGVPFLFSLPLSRARVLLGLETSENTSPRTKELPQNLESKSPLSLGSPTPAWGLLGSGNWEQLSVCYLKGTHFIRIFSQGPCWGASSRCRFLGWEERVCPQDPHRFLCQLLRGELHRVRESAQNSLGTWKAPCTFNLTDILLEKHRLWSQPAQASHHDFSSL